MANVSVKELKAVLDFCAEHSGCRDDNNGTPCPWARKAGCRRILMQEISRQNLLDDQGTATFEVTPRVGGGSYIGCSICGAPIPTDSGDIYIDEADVRFCFQCGARLEEERNEASE